MRYVVIAAAALAVSGLLTVTSSQAEPRYVPGGPAKLGNVCQASAGGEWDHEYGYITPCPKAKKVAAKAKKKSKKS